MAAYELTIKAMSRTDLETAVLEAADWFRPVEARAADGAAAHTPASRPRGRPRGAAGGVPATAHSPAAGEASADGGAAAGGDSVSGSLGDAADGDAGALEPQGEAQDSVEAGSDPAEGAGAAEAEAEASTQEDPADAEADDAGAVSGAAAEEAADGQDIPGDADGAAAVGDGEDQGVLTIEDIKTAAAELIGKKGFQSCKKLFAEHGVTKPGATPEDKFPAVMAALKKALG